MTAKTELTRQLLATFAAGTPTAEELDAILKGYIIFKENDEQRSDLKRRIKHYLGAKKIDGLSARTLANYRSHLELFASKVTKSTAKITTDDIRGYIAFFGRDAKSQGNVTADAYQQPAGVFRLAHDGGKDQEEPDEQDQVHQDRQGRCPPGADR